MLVLSRHKDEQIVVGGGDSGFPEITITVCDIRGDKVRVGVDAPRDIPVHRRGVHDAILRAGGTLKRHAPQASPTSTAAINKRSSQ
ncbi:carbon storage regulator [Roseiconus lacunae]|uniref:carbon storage regulator n=1 Tax=Roseiconus lacunae TaxID=2605694 RepID=UPI001E5C1EEC|nr:carbon storage regulator [Roseiconus lacunae]MCD0459147.1 carbon storage regulator [Roseiconus lacunae]